MKVSYSIGGFNKHVVGTLLSEDEEALTIRARDGKKFTVMKRNIEEVIQ